MAGMRYEIAYHQHRQSCYAAELRAGAERQLTESVPFPRSVWLSVSHSRCPAVSTVAK